MLSKKFDPTPKKKVIESFRKPTSIIQDPYNMPLPKHESVEVVLPLEMDEDSGSSVKLCACGKATHPAFDPQCWDCAHRA